jgi:ATP-dependent DNA ligase
LYDSIGSLPLSQVHSRCWTSKLARQLAFDVYSGQAKLRRYRAKPLDVRKAKLADLLQGCAEPVRYCDHIVGMGKGFFEAVREVELEGMVAKRRRSKYAGVFNDDWLKIRCMRVHDFVIGPWVSNGDEQMGTLLLGEFVEGVLRYVGTVGSPSDSRVMRSIARLLSRRAISPFRDDISEPTAKSANQHFAPGSSSRTSPMTAFCVAPRFGDLPRSSLAKSEWAGGCRCCRASCESPFGSDNSQY